MIKRSLFCQESWPRLRLTLTSSFHDLLSLSRHYRCFLNFMGWPRAVALHLLGVFSSIVNLIWITAVIPFLSVIIDGKERFLSVYVTPYFHHLSPFISQHLELVFGICIVVTYITRMGLLICFTSIAARTQELYAAKIRDQINMTYLSSFASSLEPENKSVILYLNNNLVQFAAFCYGLIELNLKLYFFTAIIAFMVTLSLKLTLFSCALIILISLFNSPIFRWSKNSASAYYSALKKLQGQLGGFLDGVDSIKTLGLIEEQYSKFSDINQTIIRKSISLAISRQLLFFVPEMILVFVLVAGVLILHQEKREFLFIVTYFYTLIRLVSSLNEVGIYYNNVLVFQKVADDIARFLGSASLSSTKKGSKRLKRIERLEFRDITLRAGDKVILEKISFCLPIGRKIQLLGENGSGKTALIKCLLRLLPYDGMIQVNQLDLQSVDERDIYSKLSYHGQSPFLFNETVISNLLAGNPSADPETAVSLCKELGFERVIAALDLGYETIVSENATNLSGGEKQAICLVRTLLRAGEIVILDEPMNHLDAESVGKVSAFLAKLPGKTLIIVTHQPVPFCDFTVRLQNGRMISTL